MSMCADRRHAVPQEEHYLAALLRGLSLHSVSWTGTRWLHPLPCENQRQTPTLVHGSSSGGPVLPAR
eukprot:41610-Eustigmatos_ZCMA.PRE.1